MPTRTPIAQCIALLVLVASPWLATTTFAQTPVAAPPPPPPKVWTVSASAGWTFTQGNSDTSSVNLGYSVTYDPQKKNLVKSEGLFLRSKSDGDLIANRLAFSGRDQYKLNERAYVFGQLQYLRDQFKGIEYLVAPTGGLGYTVIMLPNTELSVDGGAGASWEKDTGVNLQTSGALSLGNKFTQKLSKTATFTQTLGALWKTKDLGDALYVTRLGVSASVAAHTELKIEWLDAYKRKPAAGAKPNDIALLFALVFKN